MFYSFLFQPLLKDVASKVCTVIGYDSSGKTTSTKNVSKLCDYDSRCCCFDGDGFRPSCS